MARGVYGLWPRRRACPPAVCLVSNRLWRDEGTIRKPGDGQQRKAATWEQYGVTLGTGQEISGVVEATFLERMVLLFLDLTTGYRVLEAPADERSYALWKALVDQRLTA